MVDKKVLLVGAGRFGANHLRNLCVVFGNDNVYVADANQQLALDQAGKNGVDRTHVSLSMEGLLDRVDAVDIVTPTQTHFDLARAALEAGKDVLVEKPMTMTSREARMLCDLARDGGRILQPGHLFRYNPATDWMKQYIEEGKIGDVFLIEGHFGGFKRPRTDVGVAFTDGCHLYDLSADFFGRLPKHVTAKMARWLPREGDLEDWASVVLDFDGGSSQPGIASIKTEYFLPGTYRDMTIIGTRGAIMADVVRQKVKVQEQSHEQTGGLWTDRTGTSFEPNIITQEPLLLELTEFYNSLTSRKQPRATPQDAYNLACIIEAMYTSDRERRRVEIVYDGSTWDDDADTY